MLLRETIRFFSQHRTLYCYLCLSLWIFLLIAGMYKYISTADSQSIFSAHQYQPFAVEDEMTKLKKLQTDCNPYRTIVRKDDGGIFDEWKLQGVIMLTRHGDRGPMAHVRGINTIDCGAGRQTNVLLNKYRTFLLNTTVNAPAGHYIYNKNGPFHNFPLLPAFSKACLLGQLTYNGIAQMLQLGDLLRSTYAHSLGLLGKPILAPKLLNTTQSQTTYPPEEIIIYSTRYRRTFQSAMALMYAFLPERWLSLNLQESHSLAFCFADCACPKADQLSNLLAKEFAQELNKHPTVAAVVQWIGSNVLQNPTPKMQPLEVRDAILSLICHNAQLPCRRSAPYYMGTTDNDRTTVTTTESNDLINIDQDDNNVNSAVNMVQGDSQSNRIIDPDSDAMDSEIEGCVEASHVTALMSYTQWQGKREAQHKLSRQQGLLRAYGLIRNIVNHMLKIISDNKVKFVLYSGHDRTFQFLLTALGIFKPTENGHLPKMSYFIPYASRIAFEVYKSDAGNGDNAEYYFRVINNGQDITRMIEFCEGGRSLRINKNARGSKADLCPIENIIRFIHDDYFTLFNATNQKDACSMQKNNEF
ncbi:2-phosphoxylose phosphatase 1 [Contarinia nasturtii]|uniref:2-phosphoxylose phosphatase 1 n=1 Tax=Contarinia nasturtii TaxID=265458 RepID=UPI0012D3DA87|nr:2-phosphoxylose phosphatase 1 [Contarinia nasturtii]